MGSSWFFICACKSLFVVCAVRLSYLDDRLRSICRFRCCNGRAFISKNLGFPKERFGTLQVFVDIWCAVLMFAMLSSDLAVKASQTMLFIANKLKNDDVLN